jgi:3-hydroxymyristoyl/3-hydroxydecanoyl-(acyl carrier protein) dehydratase
MSKTDEHILLRRLPAPGGGFPRVISIAEDLSQTRIRLDVSEDLCWFRGHFPGQPVLPGIVQLHWSVTVCRALFGFSSGPWEIKRLKFKKVLVPPKHVDLSVLRQGEREAQFRFSSDGEENSEGRIGFSKAV